MKMAILQDAADEDIWVNPMRVLTVVSHPSSRGEFAKIRFSESDTLIVQGSATDVGLALSAALSS